MHERLRRLTAGRPIVDPDLTGPSRRRDLVYRPVWRPAGPDQLDALITDAAR